MALLNLRMHLEYQSGMIVRTYHDQRLLALPGCTPALPRYCAFIPRSRTSRLYTQVVVMTALSGQ